MSSSVAPQLPSLSNFDTNAIEWQHFDEDPRFDYPINYSVGILGSSPGLSPGSGTVDFLGKWAPNSYCHYHRHLGDSMSLILEGEHHTVEMVDGKSVHTVRQAGSYVDKPGGDVHMEYSGPEGVLVFFRVTAVDGKVFEVLGKNDRVLNATSYEDFVAGNLPE